MRLEEQLADGGVLEVVGPEHLYPTVRAAVDGYASRDGGP